MLERIARTCNAKEVFLNISEALSLPKDDMPIETAIYLFTLVQIGLYHCERNEWFGGLGSPPR